MKFFQPALAVLIAILPLSFVPTTIGSADIAGNADFGAKTGQQKLLASTQKLEPFFDTLFGGAVTIRDGSQLRRGDQLTGHDMVPGEKDCPATLEEFAVDQLLRMRRNRD